MVTMVEVARRAGVSIATVSRVINKTAHVDKKTRDMVQAVIKETDYRPNAMAQSLVSQSSKTIGVVVNHFGTSYYGMMMDGVEHSLSELGFKTIAESSRISTEGELNAIASLLDRQCEGVILHSNKLDEEQLLNLFAKHPKLVLLNRPLAGFEDRCVYVDHIRGGELAASYLFDHGHRDVAIVTGFMSYIECQHRLKGFCNVANSKGIHIDPDLIYEGEFSPRSGRQAMLKLLATKKDISAIFFMNDEMAAGALNFCLENGISIPNDISILGYDNLDIGKYTHPKLSTIHQPLNALGAAAGKLAHAVAIGADRSNLDHVLNCHVHKRASVKLHQHHDEFSTTVKIGI